MKKVLILIMVMLLLTGCSKTAQTTNVNEEKTNIEKSFRDFAEKNNAPILSFEDSLNYTIDYQNKILLNKPLAIKSSVEDVYRKNGKIYIELSDILSDFTFILECPEELATKVTSNKNDILDEYALIVSLTDIKKFD